MSLANTVFTRIRTLVLRTATIPAAIALLVVGTAWAFFEQQNQLVHHEAERAEVLGQVSLIRSRLEGGVNANIQLVRGLVSVIATEPDMSPARFDQLAENLFAGEHDLRNVAAAPGLVISMVYPLQGNEGALGLNYLQNDAQREAALRARDTGDLVLAGPVELVQGGIGFIGRFPVFHSGPQGQPVFWGMVSAVVDAMQIYDNSGLTRASGLDIAITGKDASGPDGDLFYGSGDVIANDPVTADVILPFGSWRISATPEGGWSGEPANVWTIRLGAILAGCLVILPIFVVGFMFDERTKNRREVKVISRRLELALQASNIGVWENNVTKGELFWDRRVRQLYGFPPDAPVDVSHWTRSLHPDDAEQAIREFNASLTDEKPYLSNFRLMLPDNSVRHIRSIGSVDFDHDGNKRIIGINVDVTEDVLLNEQLRQAKQLTEKRNADLEIAKSEIEKMAMHDALTGLPNRRALDDYLSGLSENVKSEFGLLHIDLDRFKQINDTLGHAAGDATLVHTARVLRDNVRDIDFVARIGGDEFVVVCMPECTEEGMEILADRIVETMREPLVYHGRPCRSGVSIGVAMSTSSNGDAHQLLINADIALYRAKNLGRNTHRFFSRELHAAAIHTKRVADEILTGIDDNQFVAHYQGQFDATTREIIGVEALVRWNHPGKGLLLPAEFIEIAEDLNVLATLDATVLDQSLKQMNSWRRSGIDVPRVAVNVSARRLKDPNLVETLKALEFEPGTLAFELVESTFLDQRDDQVVWNLDQIRELGIQIEIDDFGTGYASIVSLMELKPDRLKIDRQLVLPTVESANQRDLVRSIVDIGRSLDIESLAEGVETMQHADIMRDIGCTTLQGFAFARPMSGRAFTHFARKHAEKLGTGMRRKGAA